MHKTLFQKKKKAIMIILFGVHNNIMNIKNKVGNNNKV